MSAEEQLNLDASDETGIAPKLGLWDAISIIIGIVVGTAIFKSPTFVFQNVSGPVQAVGVWLLGAILSLIGALCYAELATTYPKSGGDYHYLTRAYGRPMGFLFGWAQLVAILTGSIGAMAYAFADYGVRLWGLQAGATCTLAVGAIVALSAVNLLGVVAGKVVQNILSVVKVLGLLGIVLAGLFGATQSTAPSVEPQSLPDWGLAMVFVLYAYGGWNDAAFVAADVRNRRRNIPLALFLGIGIVSVIYILVILAFLFVLGFDGARNTHTPATDVLEAVLGPWGGKWISLLVMISALGAINGLILTGSRIHASLGADHSLFSWLGRWNSDRAAPIASLVAQAAIAVGLVLAVGSSIGRATIDGMLGIVGLDGLPWDKYYGGFETLVAGTAPVFWGFFLLTGMSLFILRRRDPGRQRPFTVPWYPLPPIVFCCMCLYMLYKALAYAEGLALLGLVPLAIGIPLYGISQYAGRARRSKPEHG